MSNTTSRKIRHIRLRKKVFGIADRPRLAVHFSGKHITVQVINDVDRVTLVSVNTTEALFKKDSSSRANVATAMKVGTLIAERGLAKKIDKIVFDRGGFKYHGKVKALAEAARKGGLQF